MKRLLVIPLVLLILQRVYSQNMTTGNDRPCGQDNLSCLNTANPDDPNDCLVLSELCDETNDCTGGADEGTQFASLDCNERMFRCTGGEFVTLDLLCDGINQCTSGADERSIICENKCLLPYYGGCDFTRECVSTELGQNCGGCLPGLTPDVMTDTWQCLPAVFLTLDATSYSTSENAATVQVCVSGSVGTGNLSDIAGQSFEVNLQLFDGSAMGSGVDYTWTSTSAVVTLTFDFTNLMVQQCMDITIINDNLIEDVEEFSVSLIAQNNANGQIILQTSSASVSIADNDVATFQLSPTTYTVEEDDGNAAVIVECVGGGLTFDIEVTFETIAAGSTATAGLDYTATTVTLTFSAGNTSGATQSVNVGIIIDVLVESDEFVNIQISGLSVSAGLAVIAAGGGSGNITIINVDILCDAPLDIANGVVTFTTLTVDSTANYTCNSGYELVGVMVRTCTLTGVETAAFTPAEPLCRLLCPDPTDIVNGMVTFTGNSVGDTATYTCSSGFVLIGSATATCMQVDVNTAAFSPAPPVCSLMCPDPAAIANGMVTFTDNFVGDTATYTCNLQFEPIGNTTVTCTQVDVNAAAFSPAPPLCRRLCPDPFPLVNGMVTFTGNSIGDTGTYTCNPNFELIGNANAVCGQVNENTALFSPPPECRPLCSDPPDLVNGTVTFTGNSIGDTAIYICNSGFVLIGIPTATCWQLDTNTAIFSPAPPECRRIMVSLEMPDPVPEGQPDVEICANLTNLPVGGLQCDLVLTLSTTDGTKAVMGEDYSAADPLTITFLASIMETNACTNISIIDDDVLEADHDFTVSLDSTSPGCPPVMIGTPSSVSVTIQDNDNASVSLEKCRRNYTLSEGDGDVMVCAEISDLRGGLECDIVVTLSQSPGAKAAVMEDFSVPEPFEVTFPSMTTTCGDTACASIGIIDDDSLEGLHSFEIAVGTTTPPVSTDSTSSFVFIEDNEDATVSLQMPDPVDEGDGTVNICADLRDLPTEGLECDIVLTLLTTDGTKAVMGEDYSAADPLTITFLSTITTNTSACTSISIMEDAALEGDHDFTVSLDSTTPPVTIGIPSSVTVTIQDNEDASVELEKMSYTFVEDDDDEVICAVISAVPTGGLECDIVATLNQSPGANAAVMEDFTVPDPFEVTFPSMTTTSGDRACAIIDIIDDDSLEGLHSFGIALNMTTPPVSTDNTLHSVFIEDNDEVTVSVQESSISVLESAGSVDVCVEISGAPEGREGDVVATISTLGSSIAVSGVDFIAPTPPEVTFPANSSATDVQCVQYSIINDNALEGSHDFTVEVIATTSDTGANVQIGAMSATIVEIQDDEDATVALQTPAASTVDEGDGFVTVCAEIGGLLAGGLERDLTVTFVVSNITAVADQDFELETTEVAFPAGVTVDGDSVCVNISIVDDEDLESNQNFSVSISRTLPPVTINDSIPRINIVIQDNDILVETNMKRPPMDLLLKM